MSPGLIRFASRFTRSIHDAEDAYQRAMEIALTKAPVTDREQFLTWLRTVLKHEALAVAGARAREAPGLDEDVAQALVPASGPSTEALAEWRARYLTIQDAIGQLSEAQRICLMLQVGGSSYARISQLTGFSPRKVERSVIEGRGRLRAWEIRIDEGQVCWRLDDSLERAAQGEADRGERRAVRRHVRHCQSCRVLLADRRHRAEGLAALVPVALLAQPVATATPDPGPYMAAWDRAFGGLTVRAGQLIHVGLELPGSTLGRVAAGAGALVLALFTGVPVVADLVGRDGQQASDAATLVAPDTEPAAGDPPAEETRSPNATGGRHPATTDPSAASQANQASRPAATPRAAASPPRAASRARAQRTRARPHARSSAATRSATQVASVRAKTEATAAGSGAQRMAEQMLAEPTGRHATPAVPAQPSPRSAPASPSARPAPSPRARPSAAVVIPHEEPAPSPDGVVIYGD